MMRLGRNTLVLASSSVVVQAITAVTYFLVARSLAPEEFGRITGAVGIATLILTALDFGINSLTVRQLARDPEGVEVFTSTLSAKLLISTIAGLVWVVAILAIGATNAAWRPLWLLGPYIAFSDIASALLVLPKSRERMQRVAVVQFVQKSVCLVITVVMIGSGFAVEALLVGLPFGALVSILVCLGYVEPPFRRVKRPDLGGIKELWTASAGFGVAGIAAQLQRADIALVGASAGPVAAGLYAAPARITNMVSVLPSALSVAMLPRVASTRDRRSARREGVMAIAVVVGVSAVGLLIVGVLADQAVQLVLGADYSESVPVLRIFLVGVLIACANAPIAAMLQAEGKDAVVAKIVGFASLVGLGTVWLGALLAGAQGAAAGYIVLQIAILFPLLQRLRFEEGEFVQVVSVTESD